MKMSTDMINFIKKMEIVVLIIYNGIINKIESFFGITFLFLLKCFQSVIQVTR